MTLVASPFTLSCSCGSCTAITQRITWHVTLHLRASFNKLLCPLVYGDDPRSAAASPPHPFDAIPSTIVLQHRRRTTSNANALRLVLPKRYARSTVASREHGGTSSCSLDAIQAHVPSTLVQTKSYEEIDLKLHRGSILDLPHVPSTLFQAQWY